MKSWKEKLYNYGYLVTSDNQVCQRDIGIDWDKWNKVDIAGLSVYTHFLQRVFTLEKEGVSFVLIGHAYNPFTMEKDEMEILNHLASLYKSEDEYRDYFDEITGVFLYLVVDNYKIIACCDCAGMMGAHYAKINEKLYYSSHFQMIADIYDLKMDKYVAHMKKSRFFKLYGWYLPADLTCYKEIRRIVPNVEVVYDREFKLNRFYPRKEYDIVSEEEYIKRVKHIGEIIHNNMVLISKKWKKPAVSMTGGMDSKTTLACANGVQKDFNYFSYISLDREELDANAARKICKALELEHKTYIIPTDNQSFQNFNEVDNLVERHYGYLGKGNQNDIRKRIYLDANIDFDVEVKSWVSEIARASRYGKYHKNKLPKRLSARRFTSMYKIFIFNRLDVLRTDKIYKKYIKETKLQALIEKYKYPWSEFFVWEGVFGGWGGLTLTGEHKLTNDITVPYNNRALIDLMFRTPLEKRKTDSLHSDIIEFMDKRIFDLNIHVVNGNETKKRAILEGLYFDINSHLPI